MRQQKMQAYASRRISRRALSHRWVYIAPAQAMRYDQGMDTTTRERLTTLLAGGGTALTSDELAQQLGVSGQRVRQLLADLGAVRDPARWRLPEAQPKDM